MARYNEINIGRINRFLQKLLDMKGGPPAPQLSSEVTPVLPMFNGAENRYLESWERFGAAFSQPAVAANLSGIRFRNPAGSNLLAVFEKIVPISLVQDQPSLAIGGTGGVPTTTDLGTVVALTGTSMDGRGRPTPTLIASRQASAATVPGIGTFITQAVYPATGGSQDMIAFEDQEVVLTPGMAMQLTSNIVNTTLAIGVFWRERFLEDSERA